MGENKPVHALVAKSLGSDLEAEGAIFGRCSVPYVFHTALNHREIEHMATTSFLCFGGFRRCERG
jgi:hypothetical protein